MSSILLEVWKDTTKWTLKIDTRVVYQDKDHLMGKRESIVGIDMKLNRDSHRKNHQINDIFQPSCDIVVSQPKENREDLSQFLSIPKSLCFQIISTAAIVEGTLLIGLLRLSKVNHSRILTLSSSDAKQLAINKAHMGYGTDPRRGPCMLCISSRILRSRGR